MKPICPPKIFVSISHTLKNTYPNFWSGPANSLKKTGFFTSCHQFSAAIQKTERIRRNAFFFAFFWFAGQIKKAKLKKNGANMSSQSFCECFTHFQEYILQFLEWTHEQFLKKNGFLQVAINFLWQFKKPKELGETHFFFCVFLIFRPN